MRTMIETLNRLLAVPSVEGVAFFASNGASYCARLDGQVAALEKVAPSVTSWFQSAGTDVRFVEMRSPNKRFLWFRAGSGALFVAANPKAHAPSLASRIALSIVSLVDSVGQDKPGTRERAAQTVEPPAQVGTPTIPAPESVEAIEAAVLPPNPVVTFLGEVESKKAKAAALLDGMTPVAFAVKKPSAVDADAAKREVLFVLNALSARAASALGGPVRRNYFNRARKTVAATGPLYAFEIDLDGKIRCETLSDLSLSELAPVAARWCRSFIENVSVIEPSFSQTSLEALIGAEHEVLVEAGFLGDAKRGGGSK